MPVMERLERLGGVFASPRKTLARIAFGDEGTLYEPLGLFILSSIIAAPSHAGRALLFFRASPLEGLGVFANLLAERLWPIFAGALGTAVLLHFVLAHRRATPRPSFSRLVDLGFYLMLPLCLLSALGATLAHFGLDLWFLPHRLATGAPSTVATRLLVAYLPTLGLLSWFVTGPVPSAPSEGTPQHEREP